MFHNHCTQTHKRHTVTDPTIEAKLKTKKESHNERFWHLNPHLLDTQKRKLQHNAKLRNTEPTIHQTHAYRPTTFVISIHTYVTHVSLHSSMLLTSHHLPCIPCLTCHWHRDTGFCIEQPIYTLLLPASEHPDGYSVSTFALR
jgi:hypothetical protein